MDNNHTKAIKRFHQQITGAGSLIAIGIVFGDIGTSPLYTLNAVFHGRTIDAVIALGSLSCIFWTLTFQTTLKYVILTLRADNHGEGGIFSLYALVRRFSGKWLIYAAMAGGAFLMADGIITPPISVASAVEGLEGIYPNIHTVPIILVILVVLFLFQQFGTNNIGKVFGPLMIVWFGLIGFLGILQLKGDWQILKALNPYYAYRLLVQHPGGFWLLGSIFLCTTGAEALYSDMGHCGRNNIRISWGFIKAMLVLNYAGQTAWLLQHAGGQIGDISPFFHIVPPSLYIIVLIVATLATIIASQSLISGCFTLVNEAIRLGIWPRHKVEFPSNVKGQLYIPAINWFLMIGCLGMVLHFKRSTEMEAAFGLSVTLTMLMSTVLIFFYLRSKRWNPIATTMLVLVFLTIEISFLIANLQKIKEGGWITLVIGAALFTMMYIWYSGRTIKQRLLRLQSLPAQLPDLHALSTDEKIPKYATNLVYMTISNNSKKIEHTTIDSIFHGAPKRADTYWFVHVNVTDDPYSLNYTAQQLVPNDAYYISFDLGFRVEPRIDYLFRQVVETLVQAGEVNLASRCENRYQSSDIGDFKFIISEWFLSYDNDLPYWKRFIMKSFYNLKMLSIKEGANFGLDPSNLVVERYPLIVAPLRKMPLKRI